MTKQEALKEIIELIDGIDKPDDEGSPTHQPTMAEMDDALTTIYELCEAALID